MQRARVPEEEKCFYNLLRGIISGDSVSGIT